METIKRFVSDPFFKLKVSLENKYTLFVIWNIFEDKKDDMKLVMRTRYLLEDEDGERCSLKVLELTQPVKFEQVEIEGMKLELVDNCQSRHDVEMIVSSWFGQWINVDFKRMIDSGNSKITAMENVKLKWEDAHLTK